MKKYELYEEKLFQRIDKCIKSLLNNGWEYELWNLDPHDRKRIHSYIATNYDNIISKSRWEWKKRQMFLLIKNKKIVNKTKLTIDIDWNWI